MRIALCLLCAAASLQNAAAAGFKLEVVFSAGNIPDQLRGVLDALHAEGLIPVMSRDVPAGTRPIDVVRDKLDMPASQGWETAAAAILRKWNPDVTDPAIAGQFRRIRVPDLDLDTDSRTLLFNVATDSGAKLLSGIKALKAGQTEELKRDNKQVRLRVAHRSITIDFDNIDRLARAVRALEPLRSETLTLVHPPLPLPAANLRFDVFLEGGEVHEDAQAVVKRLVDLNLVRIDQAKLKPGESPQDLYRRKLNVQGSFVTLALQLNPGMDPKRVRAEIDLVRYPDVRFKEYEWTLRLDRYNEEEARRERERKEKWSHLLKAVKSVRTGQPATDADRFVDMVFRGYELSLTAPDAQTLASARKGLLSMNSGNVRVSFPQGERPVYGRYVKADQLRDPIRSGIEASAGCYVGSCDVDPALEQVLPPTHRSKVIVLDPTPVDLSHPDLGPGRSLVIDGKQTLAKRPGIAADHATHMAGIVAGQINDFGILGLNPQASIVGIPWKDGPAPKAKLEAETRNARVPITLYASSWPAPNETTLAPYLINAKPFWVVAAGQCNKAERTAYDCDDHSRGLDFDTAFKASERAPTNLAHLSNILVATGCESCFETGEQIPQSMNRSRSKVHVAAPGDSVFSVLTSPSYGAMSGTSQAAAIVAGVASAMASMYPAYYFESSALKRRIQVTSTAPVDPDLAVAAGIVNVCAARLDPERHFWLRKTGPLERAGTTCPEYKPFTARGWNTLTLDYRDREGFDGEIHARHVLRLQFTAAGWVIYAGNGDDRRNAIVKRIGPVTFTGKPEIVGTDGVRTPLSQLTDVIFRDAGEGPLGVAH